MLPSPEALSLAERMQAEVAGPVVAGLHSLAAASLGAAQRPDEDAFVCGDDADAKALGTRLAARLTAGRAIDAGPLASARALEGLTAVIVNMNKRYKAHAGSGSRDFLDRRAPRDPASVGIPELQEGDDLAALFVDAARRGLENGDVLVVAQKAVSKVEGRVVRPRRRRAVGACARARRRRPIPVASRSSCASRREVVRSRPPLVIAETRHGFVCASAGVDASNAKGPDTVVLLPLDPTPPRAVCASASSR